MKQRFAKNISLLPDPVILIDMADIVLEVIIECLCFLEIAGEDDAEQDVHIVAHADAEDAAAEIEIVDGVGDVEELVAEMRKRRIAGHGEQHCADAALLEHARRADEPLVGAGTADDDGQMRFVAVECRSDLAVHGIMGDGIAFDLQ